MEKLMIEGIEVEIHRNYYDTGELNQEWTQTIYELHGYHKTFYKNGQLKEHQEYRKGKWIGVDERFFEDGKLEQQATSITDSLFHIEIWYHDGILKSKFNLDSKKQRVGNEYKWYENGQQELIIEFSDSLFENGIHKSFYPSSKLQLEAYYKDGIFYVSKYFDDKNIQTLKDGNGVIKTYQNGILKYEDNYQNGLRNGICFIYAKSGYLRNQAEFVDGKSQGKSIWYNPDGSIEEIIYMENDVMVKREKNKNSN